MTNNTIDQTYKRTCHNDVCPGSDGIDSIFGEVCVGKTGKKGAMEQYIRIHNSEHIVSLFQMENLATTQCHHHSNRSRTMTKM